MRREAEMKRTLWTIGLFGLLALAALQLAACAPARTVYAVEPQAIAVEPTTGATPAPTAVGPSCAAPTPEMASDCEEVAQRILAATVRLEFHGPSGGIGHATIIGGRYLVTHNHYPITAAALNNGGEGVVTAISVFKANGEIILLKAPLSYFKIVGEEAETLVLDFFLYSGVGFFDSLGVPSADWGDGDFSLPQPGSEVAQINWDGSTTRVDWVRVIAIHNDGGNSTLELDNFVEQGASGGGVFYNGVHVGNNWSRQTERLTSGEILRQYSVAALNTADGMAMVND
jgi:hypothetical protein